MFRTILALIIFCDSIFAQRPQHQVLTSMAPSAGSTVITHFGDFSAGAGSGNPTTATTGNLDTSSCSPKCAIICAVGQDDLGAGGPTVSDNKGNTFTTLTYYNSFTSSSGFIAYVLNASHGSGHNVSTNSTSYPSIACIAFTNVNSFDTGKDAGTTSGSASSLQVPSSLTPIASGALFITGTINQDNAHTATITSPTSVFTIGSSIAPSNGLNMGAALAYEIQTSATARQPTWDQVGSNGFTVMSAVFLP